MTTQLILVIIAFKAKKDFCQFQKHFHGYLEAFMNITEYNYPHHLKQCRNIKDADHRRRIHVDLLMPGDAYNAEILVNIGSSNDLMPDRTENYLNQCLHILDPQE